LIGGTFALAWGAWHVRRAAGHAPMLNTLED
jgi:hypothetical protein